jgi:hypothetical protein
MMCGKLVPVSGPGTARYKKQPSPGKQQICIMRKFPFEVLARIVARNDKSKA